ncbi:MAG TPA: oligopeptide/dipeptide ABC transporter ATP-binding protein, partial [Myxococcaceae bacterium]|nr:oligopeptide/dipeptide ABC transporter ATP-binding protein [Myxococcaceae bacterium]
MSDVVLEAKELTCHFGGGWSLSGRKPPIRAVEGVSLAVRRGRTLGVVGESGCGKSTVARMLVGLLEPTAGSLVLDGRPVGPLRGQARRDYHRRVQLVFQDPLGSLNPRRTVAQILEAPLVGLGRDDRETRRRKVERMVEQVGLRPEHLHRYPHEFSGGQAQRIVIGRALILEPEVLVLDEPVSALDVSIQAQILSLLRELQQRLGLTYVFISHDLAVVEGLCDEVAVMYLGRVVEQASREALFRAPRHPYTRTLLSAVPGQRGHRLPLQGEPPSPAAPPPGCAWAPRCYRAEARCSREAPALAADSESHLTACHFAHDSEPDATLTAPA